MHPIGFWTSALGRPEPRFGKRLTALAIATLMALLSTGPQAVQAAAEKTSPPPADTAAAGEVRKGPVLAGYRGLVGREIRNQDNEAIGEIDNVIVDLTACVQRQMRVPLLAGKAPSRLRNSSAGMFRWPPASPSAASTI